MIEIQVALAGIAPLSGAAALTAVAKSHQAPYGLRLDAQHQAPYDLGLIRLRHQSPYGLRLDAVHSSGYDLSLFDQVSTRHRVGYSMLANYSLQAVSNQPELVHAGRVVKIVGTTTLSCDEDSPVWIADIEVANVADFAAMTIGDALTLTLGIETFALAIDGKTLSRESSTSSGLKITASSPVALLDAPFAAEVSYQADSPMLAEAVVEHFVGAVDWQLPQWVIPADAITFEDVTPLRAARSVVEAIGGLIESNPDGSLVCRPRHPVSVPDYGAATPGHQLFDSDVLSSSSQIAPVRGYNLVTVSNEQGASGASSSPDSLEYVGTDSVTGTIRAYPNPSRPVELVHTGNPATTITALGTVSRQETETVEFVSGRAATHYPVASIVSSAWRVNDLGAVSFDGTALTAGIDGYSLLDITYTVESVNWSVGLDADEQVQFVLMDA